MNHKKLQKSILTITLAAVSIFTSTTTNFHAENSQTEAAQTDNAIQQVLIQPTDADTNIIPDKYNTGAKGELTVVECGETINGIKLLERGEGTINVFDFAYHNKDISGTIVFENMDFSKCKVSLYNGNRIDREIKLVFNNCKFAAVSFGRQEQKVSAEFNNCTIRNFYGSNATFNYCSFGQSYSDGIVPFQNITLNSCFIYDMASEVLTEGNIHTDGTQIYGHADTVVTNVSFDNCRFEVPAISKAESKAYVNACIMLQLEFNNADGISFTDCYVNGGGYTVYAHSKGDAFTMENVSFRNIKFGCAGKYGKFYPGVDPAISLEGIQDTDYLYIGSVWKENETTHFSVTNDTCRERTLSIYTDKGIYGYTIPACPTSGQFDGNLTYADMPFDMDIALPEDCSYAICYDTTTEGFAEQIRFVNWTDENVYMNKEITDVLLSHEEKVITSGECGKDITYTLTNSGILTLSGTGSTYSYHSAKLAPWSEYLDLIKVIKIEPGIESLGAQLFRKCSNANEVILPEGLKTIGSRSFSGCSSLLTFTFPASIETVGDAAFAASMIRTVEYKGDDWSSVTIGKQNEDWSSTLGSSYVKGDVDLDGEVTLSDAQLTLKAALKIINLTELPQKAADTDENDEITLTDAQKILKVALKIDDFK